LIDLLDAIKRVTVRWVPAYGFEFDRAQKIEATEVLRYKPLANMVGCRSNSSDMLIDIRD